jgi:superfamily I DNA/RNA helicase
MKLLLALDASTDHRHFMIVGDGQQSIYPGGFALRDLGIDVVGRSRVLSTNWRNTWSVWAAAKAVIDGQEFDDLDDDVGVRPTSDEPTPREFGELCELHIVRDGAEEMELLTALVAERLEAGVDPGDLAVLVDVHRRGEAVVAALRSVGIVSQLLERYQGEHADGVLVGTFNRSKGLEFKEVFIPGMAATDWPSRWFVPPGLNDDARV